MRTTTAAPTTMRLNDAQQCFVVSWSVFASGAANPDGAEDDRRSDVNTDDTTGAQCNQ
jgi:hypothetical protein